VKRSRYVHVHWKEVLCAVKGSVRLAGSSVGFFIESWKKRNENGRWLLVKVFTFNSDARRHFQNWL
jgi:hypothetical protein